MAGIQPEQEMNHVVPSSVSPHPDASNSEPNPPSMPISTIPALTTPDKTPATSFNLLSWFGHPLATFKASLKRRRCASSGDDNPTAGRKKKAQILGDEDDEAKARQEKKAGSDHPDELLAESIHSKAAVGATASNGNMVDCLNDDDDVYVKKEEMAIQGKEEKAKAKEQQQGSPENMVEKKWDGQLIDDITRGKNNHKVAIMSPNSKQPEYAPITIEEAAAAHPGGLGPEMNQQVAEQLLQHKTLL